MPTPPIAEPRPHTLTLHNHTRHDPYFWLRERENPDVLAYIKAENEYTAAVMAPTKSLQETLYNEMLSHIQETDEELPTYKGGYYYYERTVEGLQYPIYARKQGSLSAAEEILLNPNDLAAEFPFLEVGLFEVSPDHTKLAYSLDTTGGERFTIYFKDLSTGNLFADQIPNTLYEGEWVDNQHFIYTTVDDAWRSAYVWRHTLGQPHSVLLYHEPNALYEVQLYKTKDEAYVAMWLFNMETYEIHLLSAENPTADFALIHPRQTGLRYLVEHHHGRFFILSNENAPNNQIMVAPAATPQKENWQPFLPYDPDVYITQIEPFAGHLVLHERRGGLTALRVIDLATQESHLVTADESAYAFLPQENPEFHTTHFRYGYISFVTPETIYGYDLTTRQRTLLKQKPVPNYHAADYETTRIWAPARDGAQVPITLVWKKGTLPSPNTPFFLYGYGAYGYNREPLFDPNRLSLLDRGFIYAIAHIRGSSTMGRPWYEQGKFLHKKNSFTDFVDSAQHLIAEGYTSPAKLVIMGRSAGGLLMGAVLNMAPELFTAAIAGVPFMDVVSTMLDTSIPLTVGEFDEWGNPQDESYYHYLLSYSPYDQLEAKAYPHVFVTSGLNDPRVQYWEPTKWVAKIRTLKTDNHHVLLKTNMGAGHAGASGRYDYLREIALEYAFLLDALGMGENEA